MLRKCYENILNNYRLDKHKNIKCNWKTLSFNLKNCNIAYDISSFNNNHYVTLELPQNNSFGIFIKTLEQNIKSRLRISDNNWTTCYKEKDKEIIDDIVIKHKPQLRCKVILYHNKDKDLKDTCDIISETDDFATIFDLKRGVNVNINIIIKKVWSIEIEEEIRYGLSIILKKVEIN
jgi:hypothetical protein